jgi:hypothetical protein
MPWIFAAIASQSYSTSSRCMYLRFRASLTCDVERLSRYRALAVPSDPLDSMGCSIFKLTARALPSCTARHTAVHMASVRPSAAASSCPSNQRPPLSYILRATYLGKLAPPLLLRSPVAGTSGWTSDPDYANLIGLRTVWWLTASLTNLQCIYGARMYPSPTDVLPVLRVRILGWLSDRHYVKKWRCCVSEVYAGPESCVLPDQIRPIGLKKVPRATSSLSADLV